MPEAIEQTQEQPKELDSAKFIADRNTAEAARKAGKEAPAKPAEPVVAEVAKPAEPEQHSENRSARSARRRESRLNQQLGEKEARLQAVEAELQRLKAGGKAAEPAPVITTPEGKPLRSGYATGTGGDESYMEAIADWKAEQKLKERDGLTDLRTQIAQSDAKAAEDKENIPGWPDLAKKAETLVLDEAKHPSVRYMIRSSPVQAPLLAYFAENEDEFEDLMDLPEGNKFIVEFHRLEGAAKAWYRTITKKQAAAGAEAEAKAKPEERAHPAEAQAGRNPSKTLPKPSSEVSAKSGTPPPIDPPIGTKAWMEKRNTEMRTRGY